MFQQKKGNWGGNRKSEWSFKQKTASVNIPKAYHQVCKEYARELEQRDIENGIVYQDDSGNWVYRD